MVIINRLYFFVKITKLLVFSYLSHPILDSLGRGGGIKIELIKLKFYDFYFDIRGKQSIVRCDK